LNNKSTVLAFVLLLAFISGSVWLVFEYAANERKRDLDDWHGRLSIMAESQQHAVESWFDSQVNYLNELANNPLLQLYVSQTFRDETSIDDTSRGQLQHLRNLINATADNANVYTAISTINHNVENNSNDGIAIVNAQGILMSTRYFPVDDDLIHESYQRALQNQSVVISNIYNTNMKQGSSTQPRLMIVVPVSSIQALKENDYRAAVVAVINPTNNLYELLLKDWVVTESEETLLISMGENNVDFLSPLKNGFEIFYKQVLGQSENKISSAEGAAGKNIGGFVTEKDYRHVLVLGTARGINNTSMILVQKINIDEALAESTSHQQYILTVFLLAVFIITISFIAIWRHATSLRLQKAKRRLEARAALLNAVGDSINDHMFLLDHNNKLVFINDALAKSCAIDNVDIRGKSLNHIFNNNITNRLLEIKPKASKADVRNKEMRLELNDKRYDYHVSIVGLSHADYKQSHLYVMHDITELKDAQGKHYRLMDGIISTLAHVIDKHDPHCEHHSERTREVAIAIAEAMGLEKEKTDALAMAALLANIGKLYLPSAIPTSIEPLTEEESLMLRESTNYSVEILKDLEFDGPVIDFVQQKNEYLDGTGYPAGVVAEEIHQESRILSVANAFVAMTSSRAYREGMPINTVLEILISEADSHYDRQVIAALFHVAENHSDWMNWQQVK